MRSRWIDLADVRAGDSYIDGDYTVTIKESTRYTIAEWEAMGSPGPVEDECRRVLLVAREEAAGGA